ncbi:Folliculin-interacting protein 1 [Halocaridina rubra]|uniref:Folliculin-interacting protein 1 n=1 Tax=Halocaridina rubra TaxID=373956 RepID=A0AAN8WKC2_HALRR
MESYVFDRFEYGTSQKGFGANDASCQSSSLAGSLLGGVLDHYSSVFVLHATTQTTHWEDALRQDLSAAAHHSTLDQQVAEAVAVVADTDSWEVQVVSSHSFIVERSGSGSQVGLRVGMSPLVSAITDSILDLARLSVDPQFILQHLEECLCELYLKSQLLAEYLIGGATCGFGGSEASISPYHLPDLTRALGLDLNDLPLLLAVASTHTPALTRMFGISIK